MVDLELVSGEYLLWKLFWEKMEQDEASCAIDTLLTPATVERTFSTLRKTYLRNACGQDKLSGLAVMSVHRSHKISTEKISDSASSKSISESVKDNGEVRESSEEKNEVGLAAKAVSEQICYNKEKSFFDTISCEAIERNKGGYQKLDRDSASSKSISESVKDNGEVRESTEEKNEVGTAAKAVSEQICYNKEKSFFDTISCEAIERNKGGYQKPDCLVFACFVDAKVAFNQVNLEKLLDKIDTKGVDRRIIGTLQYCESFPVLNGVRQGGVLSPLLYNLYLVRLNLCLAQTGVGCFIGGVCFNNLSHTDDLVILAPTVAALNHLPSICDEFTSANDIVFNTAKTMSMVSIPRGTPLKHIPTAWLS
ncbi:hypothetical protein QYM36_002490 [Artemia franciscana]|uniref:Reverse transcriptase domain-containing protein n=1 Tax=Artemia franciscana TaxID=6661 RepID=A0AA88ID04_ARTSF|nr:hypothetical protein QYM36_002490 [Artemia franciscana]